LGAVEQEQQSKSKVEKAKIFLFKGARAGAAQFLFQLAYVISS
jgi:hypothetical protein